MLLWILDPNSFLMERVNPWWQSSSSTNFNFQVYWGQFFYSFLLMCHLIGKCGILSKWPSPGKKKHARDDSWICAGAIEPSILEASHTWPEVELGWLGINGLLGTSEERRRNCKHIMIEMLNPDPQLGIKVWLGSWVQGSHNFSLKRPWGNPPKCFFPCQRSQIGANTSRLASGRQQRLAHNIQNQLDI